MKELFKAQRILKITDTHAEMISDDLIMMNIVNSGEAKRNLTPDQYAMFNSVYERISRLTEERPANRKQYYYRAWGIAYEFETAGIPYASVCGGAKKMLKTYELFKLHLEYVINNTMRIYYETASAVAAARGQRLTENDVHAYLVGYYHILTIGLQQRHLPYIENEYIEAVFNNTTQAALVDCCKNHLHKPVRLDGVKTYADEMYALFNDRVGDETDTDKLARKYTDAVLAYLGVKRSKAAYGQLQDFAKLTVHGYNGKDDDPKIE